MFGGSWSDPILPAAIPDWPEIAFRGTRPLWGEAEARAALTRIREERLFRPVPRPDATNEPSSETAKPGHPADLLAGLSGSDADALHLLQQSRWRCPWRGQETDLASGLDALSFLHQAAAQNARPLATRGLSRWKCRAITPFLTGPYGPPSHLGPADPLPHGRLEIGWGERPGPTGWTAEDGFLRSVGLGLRDALPASLVITQGKLHYDATGGNAFDRLVANAAFPGPLLARARQLRQRILSAALTKYNQPTRSTPPPKPEGRLAILVPGQVENDASLRLGGSAIRTNKALLEAARSRFPDAFLLYKPHPDVETGLRPGQIPDQTLATLADGMTRDPSPLPAIAWCDRVVTMTSQLGFEALLRAKPVTTLGRPFYAGWGLTEDLDPPPRPARLTLDELVAAALILYPRYIDPISRLPAPVETAIDGLERQIQGQSRPLARLTRLVRHIRSEILNAPEAPKWRPSR